MLPLPTPRHHAVHEGHPRACANCSTELHGEYCHHCGQHAHNPVRSFAHAVEEVFESFWHLDGRIFLTLRRLLVPGRLALDYLQGRRAPYVAPMRLFVVLCVLTFFVGRLVIHLGDEPDGQGPNLSMEAIDRSLEEATTVEEVERIRSQRVADLEEAREALPPYLEPARVGMDRTIAGLHAQADARVRALGGTPAPRPAQATPQAETRREPSTWIERIGARMARNAERLQDDPDLLTNAFLGSVPTALFLLVPVFALLLKLAYLGSGRVYLEHLVVALYSHAFLCLALLGEMLLSLLADWTSTFVPLVAAGMGMVALALWLWMPTYLLLMQKRVYGDGWVATLLRFGAIGTVYSVMMLLAAVVVLLLSLVRL